MSSPKAAVARPARRSKPAKPSAVKPARATAVGATLSADAGRVAADMERALAEGRSDLLSPETFQALMAALCRSYAMQVEAGSRSLPLQERGSASSTDVMIMASALLRSANLAVFELGMWQSWTGR